MANVIVDAMGGDNAPVEIIKGCCQAIDKSGTLKITLVGKEDIINKELGKYTVDKSRIIVKNADEVITNDESPARAIVKKKNSTTVVGLNMIKEGQGDAFVSAGSTGALLAGATLLLKTIEGIDRPVLASAVPTKNGITLLVDSGSNVDCSPINLYQFAKMGSIYVNKVLGINNPKIGLINVGTEDKKGNKLTKETFKMIKDDTTLNFVGNIEGRDFPEGVVSVAVCDGFVGNVLLKVYEGVAISIFGMLKEIFMKNTMTKVAAALVKGGLKELKGRMDYKEVGGAPFLGVNGVVIKAHGSSDSRAFMNAVLKAETFAQSNFIEEIKSNL